jgi:hypothetical protein
MGVVEVTRGVGEEESRRVGSGGRIGPMTGINLFGQNAASSITPVGPRDKIAHIGNNWLPIL